MIRQPHNQAHRNSNFTASVEPERGARCAIVPTSRLCIQMHFLRQASRGTATALQPAFAHCQLHAPPPASAYLLWPHGPASPPIVPPASFPGPSAVPLLSPTAPAAALRLALALAAPALREAAVQLAHVLVLEPLLPALAGPVCELDLREVRRSRAVTAFVHVSLASATASNKCHGRIIRPY